MSDLVATTDSQFAQLVIELARDSSLQAQIRKRIVASRHALFNDMAPIHGLENFVSAILDTKKPAENSPLA
jgi:hypothetical protein